MLDPAIGYLIDLGGATLFAHAAWHKLRRPGEFAESLVAYRLLPPSPARRLARFVPFVEICIAAALLVTPLRRVGALAGGAALAAYAAAIALNLARGRRELDCGCAGPGRRRAIGAWMVWRNLALAALLGIAASPWSARAGQPVDLLTVVAGLAATILLYVAVDRLAGEIAPRGAAMRGAS